MSRIVVALGGSALGEMPSELSTTTGKIAPPLVDLIELGHDLVLVPGAGPQIKMLYESMQETISLADCVAFTHGLVGFHLQNSMVRELKKRSIEKSILTLVTQTIVARGDPAFRKKTKQIGSVKDKFTVFSPQPLGIVEEAVLLSLLEQDTIVIASIGGGIPVFEDLAPADAVVDKDAASGCVAHAVDADYLFILTDISKVALFFGTERQKNLKAVTVQEVEQWAAENQFLADSMLPKIQASLQFVKGRAGRKAIITSLEKSRDAILGKDGTIISADPKG